MKQLAIISTSLLILITLLSSITKVYGVIVTKPVKQVGYIEIYEDFGKVRRYQKLGWHVVSVITSDNGSTHTYMVKYPYK